MYSTQKLGGGRKESLSQEEGIVYKAMMWLKQNLLTRQRNVLVVCALEEKRGS